MNAVKKGKLEKALAYEELSELLGNGSLDARDIESTRLYEHVKELTDMAYPTQKSRFDTRWISFYVPLKFRGKDAAIPMSVVEYKGEYFVGFESTERLQHLRITKGEKEHSSIYDQVISNAAEFVPRLADKESLERMVPYDFRTGKIKGKYIMEKGQMMDKEYAKKLLERYRQHASELPLLGRKISLNDYFRAVFVAKKAVFEEVKGMSLKEAYRYAADFRHGGMLDIKNPDSVEEFNEWLESRRWAGSHPFEIVFGWRRYGIHLVPPMFGSLQFDPEREKYFEINVGDRGYSKMYLEMLQALMQEKVPVIAPQLEEVLDYLTGESYFTVNGYSEDSVSHDEVPKEHFKCIKWDALEVVKPKILPKKRI